MQELLLRHSSTSPVPSCWRRRIASAVSTCRTRAHGPGGIRAQSLSTTSQSALHAHHQLRELGL
ncbi:hypothetical protein [Acrocarpospora macrocephala]|uniref:hypothetical protein n=1 Tax=Acrocarpospora macrocephala TaxID=150177 RepID=UPI0012D35B8E|nr:hypothetical protein [Acrocarpospora macrocephala]